MSQGDTGNTNNTQSTNPFLQNYDTPERLWTPQQKS